MLFFAIHVSCCSVVCCKTNQDSSRTVSVMTFFCYTSVPLFCFKYHISLLNKSYNTIKDKNCHSVLWEQQSYQHMYPSPLLLIKFVVILGEFQLDFALTLVIFEVRDRLKTMVCYLHISEIVVVYVQDGCIDDRHGVTEIRGEEPTSVPYFVVKMHLCLSEASKVYERQGDTASNIPIINTKWK